MKSKVKEKPEPIFHPISALLLIATAIDGMLEAAEEQYETLQPARERPHMLDNATVKRIIRVFTEQKEYVEIFTEQLARWKKTPLTDDQEREVNRLDRQLGKLRETGDTILDLADELKEGTIEKVLAKSDFEIGLEFLMGKRKP